MSSTEKVLTDNREMTADEAVEDTIRHILHDVRSPLNSILLTVSILERKLACQDEQTDEHMESIRRAVIQINNMLNNMPS